MKKPKRILFLTLSFGAGHVSAAQSLAVEFQKQMPEAEVHWLDALENCSSFFRAFYVWPYWLMIRYAPHLWEKFFKSRVERQDEQTAPVWAWKKGCAKTFEEIAAFQPEIIVACEVGASEIAVIARRKKLTDAEIINVITDFEAEPIWVKPEIAAYSVSSSEVKNQLIAWGANAKKVEVCGIPLGQNFGAEHDLQKTKKRFGLDERPMILLMGGGMGPTRMSEVAAKLLRSGENLQIVALPAKDKKAKAELESLKNSETVSLHIISWTSLIAELMQATDILITKPGGLTLSEAAVCGLPCIMFDAIPGPELVNAEKFEAAGAGILCPDPEKTAQAALNLLKSSERLREMAANSLKLAESNSSKRIVEMILKNYESMPDKKAFFWSPRRMPLYYRALNIRRKIKKLRKKNFQHGNEKTEDFTFSKEVKAR